MNNNTQSVLVTVSGLRGSGKSTVLAVIEKALKVYFKDVHAVGNETKSALAFSQEILDIRLGNLSTKVFLLERDTSRRTPLPNLNAHQSRKVPELDTSPNQRKV